VARSRDRAATRRRQRPGVEAHEARWLLTQINEFPVPSGLSPGLSPSSITSGPDGNLWFTATASFTISGSFVPPGQIGMIDPTTHAIAEFSVASGLLPFSITSGPDGNLWFTESASFGVHGSVISPGKIGMINPTTHAIAEFPTPTTNGGLGGITSGPDGNLWFTESASASGLGSAASPARIGMINPTTHAIAEFPTPTATDELGGITSGPDGNLWFTESLSPEGSQIGMINPTTHAIAEFPTPTANANLGSITSGPDGNLWFTENPGVGVGPRPVVSSAQIGMISPTTHAITEFPTPTANVEFGGITSGPDGNLWFTESSQIGMINPTTHAIAEFPLPSGSSAGAITSGPDGNLWFTGGGQIGEVVLVPSITGVVSVTHSKKEIAAIILGVNEPLDSASASNRGFYSLDSGVKKRHTLVFSKPTKIGTVLYDSAAHTVTLRLAKPSKGPLQVMVRGGIVALNGLSSSGNFTAVVH
jgi:virginiamycin B lyase